MLFIVFIASVAVLLIVVLSDATIEPAQQYSTTPVPTEEVTSTIIEEESTLETDEEEVTINPGIGFWIPQLETSDFTKTVALDSDDVTIGFSDEDSISIMSEESESIIRNSLGVDAEEPLEIDGIPATKITGTSAKDGSTVYYILMPFDDSLYFMRGTNDFLTDVEQTMILP